MPTPSTYVPAGSTTAQAARLRHADRRRREARFTIAVVVGLVVVLAAAIGGIVWLTRPGPRSAAESIKAFCGDRHHAALPDQPRYRPGGADQYASYLDVELTLGTVVPISPTVDEPSRVVLAVCETGVDEVDAGHQCPYGDFSAVYNVPLSLQHKTLVVYELHSGKPIAFGDITAGPANCPSTVPLNQDNTVTAITVPVDVEDVGSWLAAQLAKRS